MLLFYRLQNKNKKMSESLIQQIENSKVEQSSSDKDKEQGKRDLKNSLNKAWEILGKVKGTPLYSRFRKNYDNLVENIKQAVEKDKSISIAERNKIIREYKEMFLLERNVKKQEQKEVNLLEKGKNIWDEIWIKGELGSLNGYGNGKLHLYRGNKNNVIKISTFEKQMEKIESIQELNNRGLYNYIQYLKSKGYFNNNFIQKFNNPIITKENLSKFEQNYKSGKAFTIEKQVERVENIGSEALVKVQLGSINSGFGNGKLHLYNKKGGNTIIDISTFEKKISGVKNIQELNGRGLYNYIQYLKSKGYFNNDFIKKFNNPIITKESLSKFEQNYKSGKAFTIEKAWEKHNQSLNQTRKKLDEGLQYIQKNIGENYNENEIRAGKTFSQKPQEKGKNTIPNSPQVKKGGEKELPLKYEKGEKIQINMRGRNINVYLKEEANGGYTLFYRGRVINKELTKKEGELIKKNPEAGGNILRFHRFYNFINLGSVWKYRNELIHAIDKVGINKDDDFLNEAEFLRLGNTIISFINKSGGGNLQEAHNPRELGETFKNFSLSNHILDKRARNSKGEDKFAELLRNNGVLRLDGSFNTIKFQEILNSQQKKS
ncbi:hypothetical protein HGA92_01170 [Candidatus Gracilibacteria bacterium]|nr:hypothetical protein [Candidatus Gracilibacteria bacterium]NUJ98780.1 hypothetical protein [Candidatus Gracilibacteria bacterium]